MGKQLPDIFFEACHFGGSPYVIERPYRSHGFVCATNGRIFVRTRDTGDWDVEENKGAVPYPDEIDALDNFQSAAAPIPQLPPPLWMV
jgi:hypothetical protein